MMNKCVESKGWKRILFEYLKSDHVGVSVGLSGLRTQLVPMKTQV